MFHHCQFYFSDAFFSFQFTFCCKFICHTFSLTLNWSWYAQNHEIVLSHHFSLLFSYLSFDWCVCMWVIVLIVLTIYDFWHFNGGFSIQTGSILDTLFLSFSHKYKYFTIYFIQFALYILLSMFGLLFNIQLETQ